MHATTTDQTTDQRREAMLRRRARAIAKVASDAGQGTVEYVGLLLLMASVLAGVVAFSGELGGNDAIGKKVVTQVGKQIDRVGTAEPNKK